MMPRMIIVYDGANTGAMAKAIAEGAASVKEMNVLVKKTNETRPEDLVESDVVLLGSPTMNKNISSGMNAFLENIGHIQLKGNIGSAFGSYGWSGEAPSLLMERMRQLGMQLHFPPMRVKRQLDENSAKECRDWGKTIAEKAAKRI
jgi:flavorubredoxin